MTSDKKPVKPLGFGLVCAGLVWLFNPNIALHDFLPDLIGMLLIYAGLRKAADADGHFEDARSAALCTVWVYALKLLLSFSLIAYPENALPFTFLSGVAESIFVILLFSRLFGAFEYTVMRGGTADTVQKLSELRGLSYLFIIVRSVCAFLPEILELIKQNDELDLSAGASYRMPIIRLKPYLTALCFIAVLILGIIFLVKVFAFFKKVKKDTVYRRYMTEGYLAAHRENGRQYMERAASRSVFVFAAGSLFLADFAIEGFDIFTDLAAFLCVALAFVCIRDTEHQNRLKLVFSTCLFGVGCIGTTAFNALISPQVFRLLSGETGKAMPVAHVFLQNSQSTVIAVIVYLLFVIGAAASIWVWIGSMQGIYKKSSLGNHDRKLVVSGILWVLTSVLKGTAAVTDVILGHLATFDNVAEFIRLRGRMTSAVLADILNTDPYCARFEALDGAFLILRLLGLVFAVFTFFELLALRSEAWKER